MSDSVKARLAALAAEGRCDTVEGRPFLSLCVLESEMRYGLALRDDELVWARAQDGPSGEQVLIFSSVANAVRFVELVEQDRDALEATIAKAARAVGIDASEAVATLPVVAVATGLLDGRTPLFCRQTLRWVRPSELRELRAVIVGVAQDRSLPGDVRSLADRMTVPETD